MKSKGLLIGVLAFVVGVCGGVMGTYRWLHETQECSSGEPRRATIRMTRSACCPGDAGKESESSHAAPEAKGGHKEHGDHAEHEEEAGQVGHEHESEPCEHEHEGKITLSDEAMKRFDIKVAAVSSGEIEQRVKLPAEIVLNSDRVAHLVPRVTGMVREVLKNVGDRVEAGELLAVLDSRELAEAKAADLATEARLKLAEANLKRVQGLVQGKIAPERQLIEAQQAVEEIRIAHIETTTKLHALGFRHDQLSAVPETDHDSFGRYEVKAPFAGTIIDKHATLGEVHAPDGTMFVLADLSKVWLEISVYAQDAARIRAGGKARIALATGDQAPVTAEGKIFYISPTLRESTRTGLARAAIDNSVGHWLPGMFVTADVIFGAEKPQLLVSNDAVQKIEGRSVVFVETTKGFETRPVELGKSDGRFTQVLSGVKEGERYVSNGAFILKAESLKGTGGHEH